MNSGTHSHRKFTLILPVCLALSLVCVAYPLYVIRPFRYQGARELAVALTIIRFRPVITIIAALTALLAMIDFWRSEPLRWKRAVTAAGAALVIALAFLARVNVYELMFHPLIQPSFSLAREVQLDGAEKVVAVRIGREARAYPIRSMSYHHLVNDVVGGVAIVATY